MLTSLLLLCLLLLPARPSLAQIQQPPPSSGVVPSHGIVCDGVTQVAATIQNVLDSVPVGTRVELPAGTCLLNQPLTITRTLTLAGAGMEHTILQQTVADQPVLTVSMHYVHVSDLTVQHSGTPVAGGDGLHVLNPLSGLTAVRLTAVRATKNWRGFVLAGVSFAWGTQLESDSNNWHGFEFIYMAVAGAVQWDITVSASQLNKGIGWAGFNTLAPIGIGPFLNQTTSFGNNQGGYVFQGLPGSGIHDLRLHNVLSSADNVAGIYLDTYGGGHLISEPWVEMTGTQSGIPQGSAGTPSVASNTGHCLGVTANHGVGVAITGGLYWSCAWSGVALDAAYSTLTGGASLGNGQALHASRARRAGVHIGGSGVSVNGHSFGFPGATTLHYLHLEGTLTDVAIGLNTYGPGLAASQVLSTVDATLTGTKPPTLAAGLAVQGPWQVLRADASAVLHSLSEAGTPAWPQRRGQAIVVDTNLSANVALIPAEPDANYFVQLTLVIAGGGPAAEAFTVTGVNKTPVGFEVLVLGAPGAGKSVVYDWLVYR